MSFGTKMTQNLPSYRDLGIWKLQIRDFGIRMFTILKMGKLSPREVKQFTLVHVARRWQSDVVSEEADPRICALSHHIILHPTPQSPQTITADFQVRS